MANKFNSPEERRAYYERNFKALTPRGHHVWSQAQKSGGGITLERERPDPGGRYSLDPDIEKIVTHIATDNIFWGDIYYRKEMTKQDTIILLSSTAREMRKKKEQEAIMSLHSLIANGGKIVVLGGRMNPSWQRWEKDPRFVFWTGDRSEIERNFSKSEGDFLPSNTHGIILSRFLSHATSARVIAEAKRRRVTIMGPKNDGEVTRLLEEITTVPPPVQSTPAPAKQEQPKLLRPPISGELSRWVKENDDATISIKESAEKIIKKMEEKGIKTSMSSLQNTIGHMRRTAGVFARQTKGRQPTPAPSVPPLAVPQLPPPPPTPVVQPAPAALQVEPKAPSSIPAPEGTLVLLKMIDDLAAGLSLLKDEVKRMHEQNAEYRALEAKLAELGFIRK